jgi:hypothetical protein
MVEFISKMAPLLLLEYALMHGGFQDRSRYRGAVQNDFVRIPRLTSPNFSKARDSLRNSSFTDTENNKIVIAIMLPYDRLGFGVQVTVGELNNRLTDDSAQNLLRRSATNHIRIRKPSFG